MFLATLDITVNVALPNITSSFGTDVQTVQWIIIFYVGSTTGLQISLGSAADTYGIKRFFIVGLVIYTLAVLLISIAPSLSLVMSLRVLQAVGNGLLVASAPALVTRAFPSTERGKALGLMSGFGISGMLVGSLVGGILVDTFGWRAIFAARVPIGLISVVIALISLRETRMEGVVREFDFKGAVTLFIGVACFILALTLGGMTGWVRIPVFTLAFFSIVSLFAFVRIQKQSRNPVLEISLLKHRILTPAFASAYLISFATFVNLFVLPFFVADIMDVNAKTWGMLLMLTPLAASVSAPLGGWLSDRLPAAYLTTLGITIMTIVSCSFTLLDADTTILMVAARTACMGTGMGLFQASHTTLVMGNIPTSRLATGGAILTMSRSMGAATSVAIMSAVLAARISSYTLIGTSDDEAFVMAFQDVYKVSTMIGGLAIAASLAYWPQFLRSHSD